MVHNICESHIRVHFGGVAVAGACNRFLAAVRIHGVDEVARLLEGRCGPRADLGRVGAIDTVGLGPGRTFRYTVLVISILSYARRASLSPLWRCPP